MKRLLSLGTLIAVVVAGCQPAAAQSSKWVLENLHTRSGLAVVDTDLKTIGLFHTQTLSLKVKWITGTDLSSGRGLTGALGGFHATLPFGFDFFAGYGGYFESRERYTSCLAVCVGKGF